MLYQWVLWFHIISMVSWFAVLFYLPRLFIYHTENKDKKEFTDIVEVMEYKLFNYIGVHAFWATLISGSVLVYLYPVNIFTTGGWFHAKLLFLVFLILYFYSMKTFMKQLKEGVCVKSSKWFRFYNEVPTLLLLVIVAMVIVKPF